mgnify:FL=1
MEHHEQSVIDLTRILRAHSTEQIQGHDLNPLDLMKNVSMVTMRINSSNVEHVRYLTTEGLSKQDRLKFIKGLSSSSGSEIFEFSTCNRVLYVGFSISTDQLEKCILDSTSLTSVPFEKYQGLDVWRHLVKVCSGLDSFIMGELQVMSQFRNSVAWHRKHGLVSTFTTSFFEHVVSANRSVRKEFDFNHTTESMLSLATAVVKEKLASIDHSHTVVLGYGDMGMKAVEVLLSLGEQKITIVTRTPSKYNAMDVAEGVEMRFLSFEQWNGSENTASMVISTVRSVEPIYHQNQKLPISGESTVMDFSWPPSIEESSIAANQTLLGMMHWIKTARNVGEEWDYKSIIAKSEVLIQEIENNFIAALSNRGNAKFRSFMYGTMEELSVKWIDSYRMEAPEIAQLRPFSREIATWICNQSESFQTIDLEQMVQTTNRPIPSSLLEQMSKDVIETVFHLNEIATL